MINPRTLLKLVKAEKENSQNKNKEVIFHLNIGDSY